MTKEDFTGLVKRFEEAAVELSWLGYRDASEHENIKQEYSEAMTELTNAIDKVFVDDGTIVGLMLLQTQRGEHDQVALALRSFKPECRHDFLRRVQDLFGTATVDRLEKLLE